MNGLNETLITGDSKQKITIQDTGLMIESPGFFRGKPHFVSYDSIKFHRYTDSEFEITLTNKRVLRFGAFNTYECERLNSAIEFGKEGKLSTNEGYISSYNDNKKAEKRNDVKMAFIAIAVLAIIFGVGFVVERCDRDDNQRSDADVESIYDYDEADDGMIDDFNGSDNFDEDEDISVPLKLN